MDVPEQKYRKIINGFKDPLTNLISQYPINQKDSPDIRNLKYIIQKESITMNLPYDDDQYESIFDDIKHNIIAQNIENRMFAIRLARALPFSHRIKIIEQCENDIVKLAVSSNSNGSPIKSQAKQKTILIKQSNNEFSSEILSDILDLVLSVYELTHLSQQIYFDVNQRICSILSRIIENGYQSQQKQIMRNSYQSIRAIFILFGAKNIKKNNSSTKLISKIVSYVAANNSFMVKTNSSTLPTAVSQVVSQKAYSNKLYHLIMKSKEFQVRIRSRFLYGLCCLLSYCDEQASCVDLLIREIFVILQNANQCDINIECFNAIQAILKADIDWHTRNTIMKKWTSLLTEISYKKQYLQHFICLLTQSCSSLTPLKQKYLIGMSFLQLTKSIPQQYSRFIIYKLSCRNIISVSSQLSKKSQSSMIILNIFQYSWFLDRIKQENDLFRSEFLIMLLMTYAEIRSKRTNNANNQKQNNNLDNVHNNIQNNNSVHNSHRNVKNDNYQKGEKCQVMDLIGLCHILLDWKCSIKQDTHIPTIKFAFDMYLAFLVIAAQVLNDQIQRTVEQLIEKCNDSDNIYFLFRFKLLSTIVSLPWYQKNQKYLNQVRFNLNGLNEQIRCFIMPKNPKPIFDLAYSQSVDGLVESRKQIQAVKIIMSLLNNLQKSHQNMNQMIEELMIDYHAFLNQLQMMASANKDLIYCLQTGTADQYFSVCQRNLLLSLIDQSDILNNNSELNLDCNILYSPYQQFPLQDQLSIFGPTCPIQLSLKFHPHNSFTCVYLQIKKNNWVSCPKLKLVVSSGMEKKEMAFQNRILEIRVDRLGGLHFQVWTAQGNQLLVASGNLRVRRRLTWRKVHYLAFVDGIKRKSYFKKLQTQNQNSKHQNQHTDKAECYLSYFYGEPLLIQIFRSCNQVLFGVSNKQVWNQIQSCLPDIIEEFTDGTAIVFQ